MDILIDTNFILTCIKQRIHLFEDIKEEFPSSRIIIPQEVIDELKLLSSKKSLKISEREAAKLSIDVINKNLVFIIFLNSKTVDSGIVNYSKEHDIILATLDKELQNRVKKANKKTHFLIIRNKTRIQLVK